MTLPVEHSVPKSIFLHLFPGIIILIIYCLVAPPTINLGFPSMFGEMIAFTLVIIVLFLYMLYEGKKKYGIFSLKNIITYNQKNSLYQYAIYISLLIAWATLCYIVLGPVIDKFLINKYFNWIPNWFFESNGDILNNPRNTLIITWFIRLIFMGIVVPTVEELYFRGFLLPRLSRFGIWSPIINVMLFSLYHFISPWQNPYRILALFPMAYLVWKKKNVYISIFTHCTVNTLSTLLLIPKIFF